jgi:hypothetical protein
MSVPLRTRRGHEEERNGLEETRRVVVAIVVKVRRALKANQQHGPKRTQDILFVFAFLRAPAIPGVRKSLFFVTFVVRIKLFRAFVVRIRLLREEG